MNELRELLTSQPAEADKPVKAHSDAQADCKVCRGFGWKWSVNYNRWFICHCVLEADRNAARQVQEKLRLQVLETIGLREANLNLDWADVKPGVSSGIQALQAVRPAYERGYGLIFLWGTYGQAKTLIGKILVAKAYQAGKRAAYANMAAVLDDIRLAYDTEYQNTELLRRMEWWKARDVLFLDELDKASATSWALDRMFQLLDACYTRAIRKEALTVIASNRSDLELDGYLMSRLRDSRVGPVVHLDGPDARQAMPEFWEH